jgi:hypothetical protein
VSYPRTKKWGHKAFLRKDVLIVNGWTYDLSCLKENIELESESRQPDNPARAQDMTQQRTGNSEMRESNSTRRDEDRAIAAVCSRSTGAGKVTSPQSQLNMALRHIAHRQQRSAMTSTRICKQTDSSMILQGR